MYRFMPLTMDMTTIRVVVAITTPNRVRNERSLWVRKDSSATQKASRAVTQRVRRRSLMTCFGAIVCAWLTSGTTSICLVDYRSFKGRFKRWRAPRGETCWGSSSVHLHATLCGVRLFSFGHRRWRHKCLLPSWPKDLLRCGVRQHDLLIGVGPVLFGLKHPVILDIEHRVRARRPGSSGPTSPAGISLRP